MKIIVFLCVLANNSIGFATKIPLVDKKNGLKLDVIPLYSVFFDVRKQLRMGIEWEHYHSKKISLSIHLDGGLYDDYTYVKNYDFFSALGSRYETRQRVKTTGFHILPACNYNLTKQANKKIHYFIGTTADINFFTKRIHLFNSQINSNTTNNYRQFRLGIGPHLGCSYRFNSSFRIEAKSILIIKALTLQSSQDMKSIKPYASVWFNEKQSIWFIPQLQIGYDF